MFSSRRGEAAKEWDPDFTDCTDLFLVKVKHIMSPSPQIHRLNPIQSGESVRVSEIRVIGGPTYRIETQ
ncbi:MAG: hypothetical protein ACE5HO_17170 [bacterium]